MKEKSIRRIRAFGSLVRINQTFDPHVINGVLLTSMDAMENYVLGKETFFQPHKKKELTREDKSSLKEFYRSCTVSK